MMARFVSNTLIFIYMCQIYEGKINLESDILSLKKTIKVPKADYKA